MEVFFVQRGLRELMGEITGKQVEKTWGPEKDSTMKEGCTDNSRVCRLLLNRRARRAELLWSPNYTSVKFSQRDKPKQENMDRQTDLVPERVKEN